jgi:hypothetical protein
MFGDGCDGYIWEQLSSLCTCAIHLGTIVKHAPGPFSVTDPSLLQGKETKEFMTPTTNQKALHCIILNFLT